MQDNSITQPNTYRVPTARQLGTILVAEATGWTSIDARVNRAVYGGSYSEFGDFVTKELIAEQWANPDRFVVKLGELRRAAKRDGREQKCTHSAPPRRGPRA